MIIINVAIYARLSRDDGTDQQSTSIENQVQILTEYCQKNNWNVYDTYTDDGYSGTNFNRPAFSRLINDIKYNKIDIVITKDLSRFGRNYLETGYYTEQFFPDNNVRFIALGDNFDTQQDNDFAPFKNIINEWYAKDISKKVKFSLNQKKKLPKVAGGGNGLYGYILNDKRERELDPIASKIIQRIFEDYASGLTSKQIRTYLFEEQIINPGYHIYLKTGWKSEKYSKMIDTDEKYIWTVESISRIIRNIEYTGDLINGKTEKKSFKNKKRTINKEEDTYIFKEVFPPIISKEIYYKANELMDSQFNGRIPLEEKKYIGIAKCKNCNSEMKYERKRDYAYYICKGKNCKYTNTIRSEYLEKILINEMNVLSEFLTKEFDSVLYYVENLYKPNSEIKDDKADLIKQLNVDFKKIQSKIGNLVESNLNDEIPYDVYKKILEKLKVEKEQIEKQLRKYNNEITKQIELNHTILVTDLYNNLQIFNELKELDNQIVREIFEDIHIEKTEKSVNLNIKYKFNLKHIIEEFYKWKESMQQSMQESQKKMELRNQNQ